ncbi:MAG TPA: multifunctional CCA tRNA nucleotidyl transferase/2'3'-cyclic phosphodiesterase/2'nucleotidase/phosphatase [Casimicrobiaceae bacterium]|nr:multifunctional CCA tRNA nucleotidyl transferase/2'3'-cyclic phosphodiesterase/2'nucleotidase/phosphatase [Casimicrobiaceae bacterium]
MVRALPPPVRVYRVGGSVRDELLGRAAGDRDFVVVGATPELMVASGYTPVGRDFPVFLHPATRDEYALARTERKSGRGYRGFRFFATPGVTLEDDLRRRDLTINAMARADDGTLIDPYGGEADLRAGVLRHISPAFAEDPLRVLRVARFAARFAFRIAPSTMALMREIVAGGELATLAPERVWQELARGLCEAHPSRMLASLRRCDALRALVPQIDALYASSGEALRSRGGAGRRLERALDLAAAGGLPLAARYAILVQQPADARGPPPGPRTAASTRSAVARAGAISLRLKVPIECRDAARLLARWHPALAAAQRLTPAQLLDLLSAVDALRRPERLETVLAASRALSIAERGRDRRRDGAAAAHVRAALTVIRKVDAASVARQARADAGGGSARSAAIPRALRAARIAELRKWLRSVAQIR